MTGNDHEVVIIGAGPAGLTAAYVLNKRGVPSTVLESDTVVGGISRTATADGWRFDIGGHRFFTKVQPVEDLWFEILGPDDFLKRPRLSRIYYRGKFYDYPISAMNALRNLGPIEAVRCVGSYVWVRVHPPKDKSTLEGFVVVALRVAPVRALLQDPEREGLGCPVHRDPGRLGRAAHQEPLALPRGVGGAQAEVGARQRRRSRSRSRA